MKNNNETMQEFNDSLELLKTLIINANKEWYVTVSNSGMVTVYDINKDIVLAFNEKGFGTVGCGLTSSMVECISDLMKLMYKLN